MSHELMQACLLLACMHALSTSSKASSSSKAASGSRPQHHSRAPLQQQLACGGHRRERLRACVGGMVLNSEIGCGKLGGPTSK